MNFSSVAIRTFVAAYKESVIFRQVTSTYDAATGVPSDVDTDITMKVMLRSKTNTSVDGIETTVHTISARTIDFTALPRVGDKFYFDTTEYMIESFNSDFSDVLYSFQVI